MPNNPINSNLTRPQPAQHKPLCLDVKVHAIQPVHKVTSGVVFAWPRELTLQTALSSRDRDHLRLRFLLHSRLQQCRAYPRSHPTRRRGLPPSSRPPRARWSQPRLCLTILTYSIVESLKKVKILKRINLSLRASTCQNFRCLRTPGNKHNELILWQT